MRGLLLAFSALVLAVPAAAQTFNGETTLGDPTFNRPLAGDPPSGLSAVGTDVHYNVLEFTVTDSGDYDFLLTGDEPPAWDTFLGLYSGSFDPSDPLTNALIYNDDDPTIGISGFTYGLMTGTSYFAIITGFENDDVGAWTLNIDGPGTATTGGGGAVPEPATWGLMILGFGAVGAGMRRRSTKVAFAA